MSRQLVIALGCGALAIGLVASLWTHPASKPTAPQSATATASSLSEDGVVLSPGDRLEIPEQVAPTKKKESDKQAPTWSAHTEEDRRLLGMVAALLKKYGIDEEVPSIIHPVEVSELRTIIDGFWKPRNEFAGQRKVLLKRVFHERLREGNYEVLRKTLPGEQRVNPNNPTSPGEYVAWRERWVDGNSIKEIVRIKVGEVPESDRLNADIAHLEREAGFFASHFLKRLPSRR